MITNFSNFSKKVKNYLLPIILIMPTGFLSFAQITYSGNGKAGGGALGGGSIAFSDDGTTVSGTFTRGASSFIYDLVIYIDSKPGGFNNTSAFTDANLIITGEPLATTFLRGVVSGTNGRRRSMVSFPPDFHADYAINVDDAGVDVVLETTGNMHNSLGNPYPSYLDSFTFLTNEAAISETQTLWVWNQALLPPAYEVKTLDSNFTIAPGQGFFVKANPDGGTFNFSKANQDHSTTDTFQKSEKTQVKLNISDGAIRNYCKIYYSPDATTGFDVGYEGEVFGGVPSSFSIYTHLVSDSEGKNYQIQSLPYSEIESMVIPVGINTFSFPDPNNPSSPISGKEITIIADVINFPVGVHLYLEDKLENSFTQLSKNDAKYTITLSSDLEGIGRFFLHASSTTLNVSSTSLSLENISIYTPSKNNLRIVGIQDGNVKLRAYNILGRQVMDTSFKANGKNDIIIPSLATGVYIVHLETETGKISKKLVVE